MGIWWAIIGREKRFQNSEQSHSARLFFRQSFFSTVSTFLCPWPLVEEQRGFVTESSQKWQKTMDKSVSGWNLVDLWLFRETGRAVFFLAEIWSEYPFHTSITIQTERTTAPNTRTGSQSWSWWNGHQSGNYSVAPKEECKGNHWWNCTAI